MSDGTLDGSVSRGDYRAQEIFQRLVEAGWQTARISGSHHIFTKPGQRSLPVAVHGGKLRCDVVRHVLRHAGLTRDVDPAAEPDISDSVASSSDAVDALTVAELAVVDTSGRPYQSATSNWAEATEEEQALQRARVDQAAAARHEHCNEFRRTLNAVQLDLIDGRLEDVDAALTPILGIERGLDEVCSKYGFDLVSEGLFFLATALTELATSSGEAFSQVAQQQRVKRAFGVSKRLMLEFKERREEARKALAELLVDVLDVHEGAASALRAVRRGRVAKEDVMERALRFTLRKTGLPTDTDSSPLRKLLMRMAETMREFRLTGRKVRLGLQAKPELNGKFGIVTEYFEEKDRYAVLILDGPEEPLLIRRRCLHRIEATTSATTVLRIGRPPKLKMRKRRVVRRWVRTARSSISFVCTSVLAFDLSPVSRAPSRRFSRRQARKLVGRCEGS